MESNFIVGEERAGVELTTTQGINYQPQNSIQTQKLYAEVSSFDTFSLTGFYDLVTISGSLLIALAIFRNHISPELGLDLAFLDEDWQKRTWGEDEESTKNKSNKLIEFKIAHNFLTLLT